VVFALETGSMPDYRLYLLDRFSGHITGVSDFHSADDVEAVILVNQRGDVVPTELWCGARKVARFDAPPEHLADAGGPVRSGNREGTHASSNI
jgi:hypothetical protein